MSVNKIIGILVGSGLILGLSTTAYAQCPSNSDGSCKDPGKQCYVGNRPGTCGPSPNRSQCTCNAASDSLEIVPSEEEINQTFDRTMEEENQSTDTNILDGGLLAD